MSVAAIQARDLGRWYGQVVGLNDLAVDIEAGTCKLTTMPAQTKITS